MDKTLKKMKKENIFIGIGIGIAVIILVGIAIAQPDDSSSTPEVTQPKEDYSSPEWVNNNLATADLSKITDWNQVDWSKMPADRMNDVPGDKIDPDKIKSQSPEKLKSLSADKLSEGNGQLLSKMGNLDLRKDVNPTAVEGALSKVYNTKISLGNVLGAPVNILNGLLKTTLGQVSLSNPAYGQDKGSLNVDKDGNIVFTPNKGVTSMDLPQGDNILIDTGSMNPSGVKEYSDLTMKIPATGQQFTASGRLVYDKGSFSIMPNDDCMINGYEILNTGSKDLSVLFDGKSYVKDSVVINKNEVLADGNGYSITTPEGIRMYMTSENSRVTVSAIPSTSLGASKNNDKNDVIALQKLLDANGFYKSKGSYNLDGMYGPNTANAVAIFQKSAGLPATGEFDQATMNTFAEKYGPKVTVDAGTVEFPDSHLIVDKGSLGQYFKEQDNKGTFQLSYGSDASLHHTALIQFNDLSSTKSASFKGESILIKDYNGDGRINNNDLLGQINDIAERNNIAKQDVADAMGIDLQELQRLSSSSLVSSEGLLLLDPKVREVKYMQGIVKPGDMENSRGADAQLNGVYSVKELADDPEAFKAKLGANPLSVNEPEVKANFDKYQLKDIIQEKADKYGIDPAIVDNLIQRESSGNPNDRSGGSIGLMQLLPGTAGKGNDVQPPSKDNPVGFGDFIKSKTSDPQEAERLAGTIDRMNNADSIDRGVAYLAYLKDKYGGDYAAALTAYNMGPGNYDAIAKNSPGYSSPYAKAILSQTSSEKRGIIVPIYSYH